MYRMYLTMAALFDFADEARYHGPREIPTTTLLQAEQANELSPKPPV